MSNNVTEYADIAFDHVITVCDNARERCPWFPSHAVKHHQDFPDPAKTTGTEEEIMASFRQVRNAIRHYCLRFVEEHIVAL
jgi:arsenate reductase